MKNVFGLERKMGKGTSAIHNRDHRMLARRLVLPAPRNVLELQNFYLAAFFSACHDIARLLFTSALKEPKRLLTALKNVGSWAEVETESRCEISDRLRTALSENGAEPNEPENDRKESKKYKVLRVHGLLLTRRRNGPHRRFSLG